MRPARAAAWEFGSLRYLSPTRRHRSLRALAAWIILAWVLAACSQVPVLQETERAELPGYIEHSYEKNSVMFSTRAADEERGARWSTLKRFGTGQPLWSKYG